MAVSDLLNTNEITLEELEQLMDGANLPVVFAAAAAKRENKEVA
jgi:hypothetical protein